MPLSFPALLEFLPRWMVNFVKCLLFIYWDNYTLFKSQNMLNYINSQILISLRFLGWAPCVMMYYLFWIEYDENWLRTFSSVFLITLFCGSPLLFFFFFWSFFLLLMCMWWFPHYMCSEALEFPWVVVIDLFLLFQCSIAHWWCHLVWNLLFVKGLATVQFLLWKEPYSAWTSFVNISNSVRSVGSSLSQQ